MTSIQGFRSFLATLVLLLAGGVAEAAPEGGFYISVEGASAGAQQAGAVLVIRTIGCHEPSKANVRVYAEGIVGDKRMSLLLRPRQTSKGVFVVERTWPDEGVWVLAVSANYRGHESAVLVPLEGEGSPGETFATRGEARTIGKGEVEAALQTLVAGHPRSIRTASGS